MLNFSGEKIPQNNKVGCDPCQFGISTGKDRLPTSISQRRFVSFRRSKSVRSVSQGDFIESCLGGGNSNLFLMFTPKP